MKNCLIRGKIYHTDTTSFAPGEMLVRDGVIAAMGAVGSLAADDGVERIDAGDGLIVPGFVDVHTHGRAGGDFGTADIPLLEKMSRSYLSAGVTTVMPTLASAPLPEYAAAAERLAEVAARMPGCRLIGIHLEGRYLHPDKRGAHARELIAPPDGKELTSLLTAMRAPYAKRGMDCPLRVSAALELDESGEFAAAASAMGARLSLGHTTATYEQARAAVEKGATGFTHLFNAMPPLHHRAGGAVMACFDSTAYGELICDGFHIAPEMIGLAWRMLGRERFVLITDSMEGTGCPDGEYHIAGLPVIVRDGKAYTVEGAIAGSTLGMIDAVNHLMQFCAPFGATLENVLPCATILPAKLAGIDATVGSLEVGKAADFLLLDRRADGDVTPRAVFVGGERKQGALA